jgi:hypothetical protein
LDESIDIVCQKSKALVVRDSKGEILKKLFVLMVAFLLMSSCKQENLIDTDSSGGIFKEKPQADTDKTKIAGLWESNGFFDGTMTQKVRIRFDQNQEKVVLGSECKYLDGQTLYAQVEAPAVFKNNGAEITAADQDYASKQAGSIKYECFANVVPVFLKIGLNGKINLEGFTLVKIAD